MVLFKYSFFLVSGKYIYDLKIITLSGLQAQASRSSVYYDYVSNLSWVTISHSPKQNIVIPPLTTWCSSAFFPQKTTQLADQGIVFTDEIKL